MPEKMKQTKFSEIRNRGEDELVTSLDRARDELFRLKLGRSTNQLENVMQIRAKRRDIARILTVISARRTGTSPAAAAGAKSKE